MVLDQCYIACWQPCRLRPTSSDSCPSILSVTPLDRISEGVFVLLLSLYNISIRMVLVVGNLNDFKLRDLLFIYQEVQRKADSNVGESKDQRQP